MKASYDRALENGGRAYDSTILDDERDNLLGTSRLSLRFSHMIIYITTESQDNKLFFRSQIGNRPFQRGLGVRAIFLEDGG